MKKNSNPLTFSTLIQDFFCQRLIQQQNVSQRTVSSYRDTFRLLLNYLTRVRRKKMDTLTISDLDAPIVTAFLQHLEKQRGNAIRTRNARFAAIRSFMKYAAAREPTVLAVTQRVLALPMKRFPRPAIQYLSREEVSAILEAPDGSNWSGKRDRMLFALLYNTGARVSEIISLRRSDLSLDSSRSVHLMGKGRKERIVPLWKSTAKALKEWIKQISPGSDAWVFPNRNGHALTRSGVEKRLKIAAMKAADRCKSLKSKQPSPHTFRHTTAMHLLQAGVDITVIALWLGHESIETTHLYIEANLAMKNQALSKLEDIPTKQPRFRPDHKLLQFLDDL